MAEQLPFAEKVAVTTQLFPLAVPVSEKFEELPKGALNTWDPPHELLSVSVPEAGALV